MPDEHVLLVDEIDIVPAVLGDRVDWSYVTEGDRLSHVRTYDVEIRDIGDLRRVVAEHPPGETSVQPDQNMKSIAEGMEQSVQDALTGPVGEIVRLRIRFRALYEILARDNPIFARSYAQLFREGLERDFAPLWDQIVYTDLAEYRKTYAAWLKADRARNRMLIGPDLDDELEAEWKEFIEAHDKKREEPKPSP